MQVDTLPAWPCIPRFLWILSARAWGGALRVSARRVPE